MWFAISTLDMGQLKCNAVYYYYYITLKISILLLPITNTSKVGVIYYYYITLKLISVYYHYYYCQSQCYCYGLLEHRGFFEFLLCFKLHLMFMSSKRESVSLHLSR